MMGALSESSSIMIVVLPFTTGPEKRMKQRCLISIRGRVGDTIASLSFDGSALASVASPPLERWTGGEGRSGAARTRNLSVLDN